MNRSGPPYLRLVTTDRVGLSRVEADEKEARREASHWYVRLREESEEENVWTQFDEWLQADPLHGKAWTSMCETMRVVERTPSRLRRDPRANRARRPNGFRHGWSASVKRKPRRSIVAVVAAACAVALALPAVSLRLRADHITSAGHVEQFRLADGSIIHLGPDSAVALEYDSSARNVRLLKGQALFEVTRNPTRPFRVVAGDVTTTVLGTSFDARMIGDATSVAVRHGHVRVEVNGVARDLRVGQWVRVDSHYMTQAGAMAPSLVGSWSDGQVLADNRSIASIIEEVRPWYHGRIIVMDPALASRRVTGIYKLQDPAQALSMIVRPYGGHVSQVTPWILVVS